MITTVNLLNICPHTSLQIYSLVIRAFKIYSWPLSNMQYSIVNYSHHAVHYISMTFITGMYFSYLECIFFNDIDCTFWDKLSLFLTENS